MPGKKKTWRNKPRRRSFPKPENGPVKDTFIREWRVYRGMETQKELAEKTGLPRPTITRLENGVLPYRKFTLETIAAALDCTRGDLLDRNPLRPASPRPRPPARRQTPSRRSDRSP
jgi:transcriptional regulator with XRE-family HTH domain